MSIRKVAFLTSGGFAPCLSSALADLIDRYSAQLPEVELIAYRHGYHGLLRDDSVTIDDAVRTNAAVLHDFGGSPIGNSRIKLTNRDDLLRRGLIPAGADPLEFAAERLHDDGVDVLHTIGGDDTSTTAADLAAHLAEDGYELTVVGLPKTIDNDIIPIRQSLGASTAAEQASLFARNVLAEHGSNPRMLVIHEVMGRGCGWLTAAAARDYMNWHAARTWVPSIGLTPEAWAIHGVYVPELEIDIEREGARLKAIMDEIGCVNIFLSEGAGVDEIVAQMDADGEPVGRDPFGHVKLDTINPGEWFAARFGERIGAQKRMVQKSGYFSRSAAAGVEDRRLIERMVEVAVRGAIDGTPGVVGEDEERGDELRVIEFERIAGHKRFDTSAPWFAGVLDWTGQANLEL